MAEEGGETRERQGARFYRKPDTVCRFSQARSEHVSRELRLTPNRLASRRAVTIRNVGGENGDEDQGAMGVHVFLQPTPGAPQMQGDMHLLPWDG